MAEDRWGGWRLISMAVQSERCSKWAACFFSFSLAELRCSNLLESSPRKGAFVFRLLKWAVLARKRGQFRMVFMVIPTQLLLKIDISERSLPKRNICC